MTAATAVRHPSETRRSRRAQSPFAPLRTRSYRIYLTGQVVASLGSWMQSVAQDWLVLQLTHSSTAVGVVLALQFLPVVLLGPAGGLLADRYPKRTILFVTQAVNAVLAIALAVLTLTGAVRVEQVYALAVLGGIVFAVDAPTRQSFVTEVVPPAVLRGAVSLNAAAFQATRLVGPAVAGVLIGSVGIGWVFALNALGCLGPTVGLLRLRTAELQPAPPAAREPHAVRAAARYVARRPHLRRTIVLAGIVGTFGLNYPIVLSALATRTFSGGAGTYALFNVALAIGSMAGALGVGSLRTTRLRMIVIAGTAFGLVQLAAATGPTVASTFALLVALGVTSMGFQSLASSSVQLWVAPAFRGRVMGLYLLVFIGGTTIGSPLVGVLTSAYGPRVGMAFCGLVPAVAALAIGLRHLATTRDRSPGSRLTRQPDRRADGVTCAR